MPGICTGNVYLRDPFDESAYLGCRSVRWELGGSTTSGKLTEYYRDASKKRLNSALSPENAAVPASGALPLTSLRGCVCAGFYNDNINGYKSYLVVTSTASSGTLSFNMTPVDAGVVGGGTVSTFNSSKTGGSSSLFSLVPSTPWTSGYGFGTNGKTYNVIMTKTGGTASVTPTGVNTSISFSSGSTVSWSISTTYAGGAVTFIGNLALYGQSFALIDETKVELRITKDTPPI